MKDTDRTWRIDPGPTRDPWDSGPDKPSDPWDSAGKPSDPWGDKSKPSDPWGEAFPEKRLLTLPRPSPAKMRPAGKRKPKSEARGENLADRKKRSKLSAALTASSALTIVLVIVVAAVFMERIVNSAAGAALDSFSAEERSSAQEVREQFYTMGYESAEAANHVSNRVTITVRELIERRSLEVMTAEDTVYEIMDADGQSWLKATGQGVYTVDLMSAEFLVDDARSYVLVRLPQPGVDVSITKAENLLYEDDRFIGNGSVQSGEDIARSQRAQAMLDLRGHFTTSPVFLEAAREQAVFLIKGLVLGLNPDVPNLTVEVEFF